MFTVNRTLDIPLYRQIYQEIRRRILQGELKPGEKIPSTRELAGDLGISRIVIIEAFELLIAEGYLESQGGSGTFVARGAFLKSDFKSRELSKLVSFTTTQHAEDFIDFRSGIPALDRFPREKWAKMTYHAALEVPQTLLGYDCPEGRFELRKSIASYLQKNRNVQCEPGQILIISGAVQGLRLIAQAMVHPGFPVLVEEPCNRDIRKIFDDHQAEVIPVFVDEQGIQTTHIKSYPRQALAVCTPSHQFPMGANLPIQRRIELINWARSTESFIVEDDYDSEYRYEGPPVSSLQGLDPDRVIYLGTFSKLLFPALRLGYMIAPNSLVSKFREIKRLSDIHSNSINQLTMARFIEEGHLERHIHRMKKNYRTRRDSLIASLKTHFQSRVSLSGLSTGIHLIAQFHDIVFSDEIVWQARVAGVGIYPVDYHSVQPGHHRDQLIVGYGHLPEQKISEGIERLKKVLS